MREFGGKSGTIVFVCLLTMNGILFSFYLSSTNDIKLSYDYVSSLTNRKYFSPKFFTDYSIRGQFSSTWVKDESWKNVKVLCFVVTSTEVLG